MLHYILQTVVFQLVFLIIYDFILKKETFFNWNRLYLLISALLSILLPFVKIESFNAVIPKAYIYVLPEIFIGKQTNNTSLNEIVLNTISISSIWYFILFLGSLIALVLFVFKFVKLIRIANKKTNTNLEGSFLVVLENSKQAFSFFNYIFLGDAIKTENRAVIIAHELQHAKEKHSVDLLFFEFLKIIFWFNPLIYIYQNRIANLHEFIADSKVVKSIDKSNYYQNLLTQVFDTQKIAFINPFFKQSLIKKRIIMLSKTKSKQINLAKYLLVLPIVIAMLFYTSCTNEEKNIDNKLVSKQNEHGFKVKAKEETKVLNFVAVDVVPVFPGCDTSMLNIDQKKCFSNKINNIVAKNFNLDLGETLDLEGRQKIYVRFTINKEGNIVNIKTRAPHPELEKEAIRIAELIPQVKPGMQGGKPVNVTFTLPIAFDIK